MREQHPSVSPQPERGSSETIPCRISVPTGSIGLQPPNPLRLFEPQQVPHVDEGQHPQAEGTGTELLHVSQVR